MSNLDQALSLAQEGFPVFPLAPGAKTPATTRGHKDASRNPATIRGMWSDPEFGVGVATGHGLAVLDVDVGEGHGADGLQTLARLLKEHGKPPKTPQVKTPSGGRHLWFVVDAGRDVRSRNGIAPGLDLKGSGGYVVAPPTKGYEWVRPLTDEGLAPLPEWITELRPQRTGSEPIPDVVHDGEGRERHLVSLAGSLRRRGLGEQAILDALRPFNRDHIRPPKPDEDLERIARSIVKYEPEEGVNAIRPPKERAMAESNYPVRISDREYLSREVPEIETLPLLGQPGFIPMRLSTLLAAYPKGGKTTLLYRCILDWTAEGRTVLCLAEESEIIWTLRIHGRLAIKRRSDSGRLNVIHGRGIAPKDLFRAAFDGPEEIVVVDTLRTLLQFTQETDNSVLAREITPWVERADATGKTLVALHHEVKEGGAHGRSIAGGHALLGIFDHAVEIKRRDGNADPNHRVVSGLGRLTAPDEFVYTLEDDNLVAVGKTGAVSRDVVRDRVLASLSKQPLTWQQVRDDLDPPKPATGAIKAALQDLAAEGDAARTGKGSKGDPYLWSATHPDYVLPDEELEKLLIED